MLDRFLAGDNKTANFKCKHAILRSLSESLHPTLMKMNHCLYSFTLLNFSRVPGLFVKGATHSSWPSKTQ